MRLKWKTGRKVPFWSLRLRPRHTVISSAVSVILFASSFLDLQAQISSAERKNKRLKEVFAQKIQEFREACYSLTGYRIDVVQEQQYKLQSMYAERSSDCLLFQVGVFLCSFQFTAARTWF